MQTILTYSFLVNLISINRNIIIIYLDNYKNKCKNSSSNLHNTIKYNNQNQRYLLISSQNIWLYICDEYGLD